MVADVCGSARLLVEPGRWEDCGGEWAGGRQVEEVSFGDDVVGGAEGEEGGGEKLRGRKRTRASLG